MRSKYFVHIGKHTGVHGGHGGFSLNGTLLQERNVILKLQSAVATRNVVREPDFMKLGQVRLFEARKGLPIRKISDSVDVKVEKRLSCFLISVHGVDSYTENKAKAVTDYQFEDCPRRQRRTGVR